MIVPAVRTVFTPRELVDAFDAAWPLELGGDPLASKAPIAVLCAQVALETANGASCFNNNVGNYKAYAGVDAMPLHTWEVVGGVNVPQVCQFASYPSLALGVQRFLHNQWSGWPKAWSAACAGDWPGYARALAAQRPPYYTALPDSYVKAGAPWFTHYAALLAGDPEPTLPEIADWFPSLKLVDA